jgi:hypothetical protein
MKYKHIFFIWLLADVLLALGVIILSFFRSIDDGDSGIIMLIILYGIAISLPSLFALLIFHAVIDNRQKDKPADNYIYLITIVVINILYWLVGRYVYHEASGEYNRLILCTTAAGIVSFFYINYTVQKKNEKEKSSAR